MRGWRPSSWWSSPARRTRRPSKSTGSTSRPSSPTYVRYRPLFEEVAADLQAHALRGARIERLTAPLKLLAIAWAWCATAEQRDVRSRHGKLHPASRLPHRCLASAPRRLRPQEPTLLPSARGAAPAAQPANRRHCQGPRPPARRAMLDVHQREPGPWPAFVPTGPTLPARCLLCHGCAPPTRSCRSRAPACLQPRGDGGAACGHRRPPRASLGRGAREARAARPAVLGAGGGQELRALVEAATQKASRATETRLSSSSRSADERSVREGDGAKGKAGSEAVRFGGLRTRTGYVFRAHCGDLCLDLRQHARQPKNGDARSSLRASGTRGLGPQAGAVPDATARALPPRGSGPPPLRGPALSGRGKCARCSCRFPRRWRLAECRARCAMDG